MPQPTLREHPPKQIVAMDRQIFGFAKNRKPFETFIFIPEVLVG
jgi:hypothetical protein